MKKAQIKKSVSALAMAAVIAVSLFGYGCGAKSASTSSDAGVSGDFTGTAKGFGGDYTAAAQSVLRNKAAAGEDLTDDPLATMALTNLSDEVLAGNGRMARRGIGGTTVFGAGADGPVDPNPLNYTRQERGYFDRLGSAVLPWGTKASDYLYVDKAGNKRYRDTPLFSDDPVLDKQIRDRIAAGTGYKE